jgi:hypothetical protein
MANLFNPSEVYNLLAEQGLLPRWIQRSPYSGARGEYDTVENTIIAPTPSKENKQKAATLAHEMSHAVQYRLFFNAASEIAKKIMDGEKVTKEERQFLDTANKTFASNFGPVGSLRQQKQAVEAGKQTLEGTLARLYPETKKDDFYFYRTTPRELQAHGLGRASVSDPQQRIWMSKVPQNVHLDPSFATEFSILMEQFKGLPSQLKENISSRSKKSVESERKNTPYKEDKFVDVFEDPFKPGLK